MVSRTIKNIKQKIRLGTQNFLIGTLLISSFLPTGMTVTHANILNDSVDEVKLKNNEEINVKTIDSGTFGTSPWRLDSKGDLHIYSGELGDTGGDNLNDLRPWKDYGDDIKKIIFEGEVVANSNSSRLFGFLPNLEMIENLVLLDTSRVTDMTHMFFEATSLTHLDLSHFDTSNVTKMTAMFYGASALQEINLSNFITSQVKEMKSMFSGMTALTSLDLSNFDTSHGVSMAGMLRNLPNLYQLTLGSQVVFSEDIDLGRIPAYGIYTGKWINVESGTLDKPKGKNVWTSREMMLDYNGAADADTYIWQRKAGEDVIVRYLDDNGDGFIISEPQFVNGYLGDDYNATTPEYKLDIPGYVLDESRLPVNAIGQFSDKTQTVTYYYNTAKEVRVRYLDDDGVEIAETQIINGNLGDAYDATTPEYKLDIPGYVLDESRLPVNAIGQFSDKAQTITYIYNDNRPLGSVTLRYVDTFGKPIISYATGEEIEPVTYCGYVGDVADDHLEIVATAGWVWLGDFLRGITYKEEPQTYDIVYDHGATIYVNYEDTNGVKLRPEWRNTEYHSKFDWELGEIQPLPPISYEVSPLDIPGYKMIKVEGDVNNGSMEQNEIKKITFIYERVAGEDVTVIYTDEEGKEISDAIILKGNIGETYTSSKKNIKNFTFKELKGNASGKFTDKAQTVTYIYTKNTDTGGSNQNDGLGIEDSRDTDMLSSNTNTEKTVENKMMLSDKESRKSSSQFLPQTGENEREAVIILMLGVALFVGGITLSVSYFRKTNQKEE